jgi:hypothetical protein
MPIQVRLDVNANPPVTVQPQKMAVNRGNQIVTWVPAAQQKFKFVSLTGLPTPPFSKLSVQDGQITVTNDNRAVGEYPYTIVVSLDGKQYSTAPSGADAGAKAGSALATAAAAPTPLIARPIIDNK